MQFNENKELTKEDEELIESLVEMDLLEDGISNLFTYDVDSLPELDDDSELE